jgi:hypothetical protein
VKEQERQKRHPGNGRQYPPSPSWADGQRSDRAAEQVTDPNPPPDLEAMANETIDRLLNCLEGKGQLRAIAIWKCRLDCQLAAQPCWPSAVHGWSFGPGHR